MALSKGSCPRASMAYSGYRATAYSPVHLFVMGFGVGQACVGALRFFVPWQRRVLGRPLWRAALLGGCTGA